jgi:hypothetical protein
VRTRGLAAGRQRLEAEQYISVDVEEQKSEGMVRRCEVLLIRSEWGWSHKSLGFVWRVK